MKELIDKKELCRKLWKLVADAETKEEQAGIVQSIIVAKLMESEKVENETDGI